MVTAITIDLNVAIGPAEVPTNRFSAKAMDDFELVDRACDGDEKVYGLLMNRYRRSVLHTMYRMVHNENDAEDLTQEAFTKAFKNISRFRKDFAFSTWLFRIAINNALDFLRKRRLRTISIDHAFTDDEGKSFGPVIADTDPTPQDLAIKKQKEAIIQTAVNRLPAKYGQLIRLRYFEQLSYQEIAETVEEPLGTVKAKLHRSKELLFEMMKKKRQAI